MNLIRIADADDPRIADYADIRERDLVGRQERFIAEGSVVLRSLVDSPHFEMESALILENRVSGVSDLLSRARENVPIYVVDRRVIDKIVGFPMHRGVLGIGRRSASRDWRSLVETLPEKSMVVVCIGIGNHDNVGAIFRNAAAFGADSVLLDETCCDPLYRKALRVSVGSVLTVPYARFPAWSAISSGLADAGFQKVALTPSGARKISQFERATRVAVLLGAEGPGLRREIIDQTEGVRIDMAAGFDSLNVATASAIALHHLKA